MPIPAYRAKQSTDTAGTGTIVLNAAATNARSFAAAYGASSRRVMYCISWATGFEIGYGDFDGGTPGSLTRATVLASSNAGALVALPAGTKDVFAVFDPAAREVVSIAGTSTLALADLGNAVVFTGASAATLNLPAIATVPAGAGWMVRNAGTAALTIDPNGAETINGAATLVLQAGQAGFIFAGGAAWQCIIAGGSAIGAALLAALNSAAAADVLSAAPVDIASAATTNIGAATSPNVRITGTTGITSFGTAPAGTRRFLTFAGVLTITYNATSLQTPGLANITTAAGDTALARSLGAGNWVLESYTRAAALPLLNSMTTGRLLGRTTAGSGQIEELTAGTGLTLSAGALSVSSVVRAWGKFNAGGTLFASFGVSSVTDNVGFGNYTINFSPSLPSADYAIVAMSNDVIQSNNQAMAQFGIVSQSASSCQIAMSSASADPTTVTFIVVG